MAAVKTQVASPPEKARCSFSRWQVAVLAVVVILIDQATKLLVIRRISEHDVIPIIPGFLNLTHSTNAGVAFGMFSESPALWKTVLLTAVSLGLLVIVMVMVWRARQLGLLAGSGLSMILGGALSNLADRIRAGAVVDFLDAYFRSYHWYTFNVADAAIVVGAGFLVIHLFQSD
jgi:signal peptidase II